MIQPQGCLRALPLSWRTCWYVRVFLVSSSASQKSIWRSYWPVSPRGDNLHHPAAGLQAKAVDSWMFVFRWSWRRAQRAESKSSTKNSFITLRSTSVLYLWSLCISSHLAGLDATPVSAMRHPCMLLSFKLPSEGKTGDITLAQSPSTTSAPGGYMYRYQKEMTEEGLEAGSTWQAA